MDAHNAHATTLHNADRVSKAPPASWLRAYWSQTWPRHPERNHTRAMRGQRASWQLDGLRFARPAGRYAHRKSTAPAACCTASFRADLLRMSSAPTSQRARRDLASSGAESGEFGSWKLLIAVASSGSLDCRRRSRVAATTSLLAYDSSRGSSVERRVAGVHAGGSCAAHRQPGGRRPSDLDPRRCGPDPRLGRMGTRIGQPPAQLSPEGHRPRPAVAHDTRDPRTGWWLVALLRREPGAIHVTVSAKAQGLSGLRDAG